MKSTDQLINEICQIKDQYEVQVTGKRKQWPLAIKERIGALAASGVRLRVVAEKTGISYHTLCSWVHGYRKKSFRELSVIDTPKE